MFDPFEVLGLEKSYPVDLENLEKHYFEAQKKTHPDRFVGIDEGQKQEVLRRSGEVNQAYLLLKDPLQRAAYLLKVVGVEPLTQDPEILIKIMEWNERLEAGEDLKTELSAEEGSLFNGLEDAFEDDDYEKARIFLYRLTYVKKLLKDRATKNR